jgi:hypothetical protein
MIAFKRVLLASRLFASRVRFKLRSIIDFFAIQSSVRPVSEHSDLAYPKPFIPA